MTITYIGLGSNVSKPRSTTVANIQEALQYIGNLDQVSQMTTSSIYQSEPWGDLNQDAFYNAVCRIQTDYKALELLCALQSIEQSMGRLKDPHRPWGPRIIDLDILLMEELVFDTDTLQIPHPRIKERSFVIQPLLELEPDCILPDGTRLASIALGGLGWCKTLHGPWTETVEEKAYE